MEELFNTMYYYTNNFYDVNLDNYLYATVPGYLRIGLVLLISSFIISALFYYLVAPVRKQTLLWFLFSLANAVINFGYALYYTLTPLINNEIEPDLQWTSLDCIFFGVTNVIWSFVAFVLISFIIKWKSICKYVPFQKF